MRVAARRGPIVEHPALAGYGILALEDGPEIAHCLETKAVGAQVGMAPRCPDQSSVHNASARDGRRA
jgi:hypothetical protein